MEAMKASLHMGTSSGDMSSKHNDRNFDTERAKNIDRSRSFLNFYEDIYQGEHKDGEEYAPFKDVEELYYAKTLKPAYENQLKRYTKKGQYAYAEKMGTFTDWLAKQPGPQEMILQIGNVDVQPEAEEFAQIADDFKGWLDETYGDNFKRLTTGYHFDEASPHAQIRGVWEYPQKDGTLKFSMTQGMKAAGIELPKPELPEGVYKADEKGEPVGERVKKPVKGEDYFYNTRQVTFTKTCREKWIEIAEEHGITIIDEPVSGATHLNTADYRTRRETLKLLTSAQEREESLKTREADCQERIDKAIEDAEKKAADIVYEANGIKAEAETMKSDMVLEFQKFRKLQSNLADERRLLAGKRDLLETDKKALEEEKKSLNDAQAEQLKLSRRNNNNKKWIDNEKEKLDKEKAELDEDKKKFEEDRQTLGEMMEGFSWNYGKMMNMVGDIKNTVEREKYQRQLQEHLQKSEEIRQSTSYLWEDDDTVLHVPTQNERDEERQFG
jgi:hypothetical protein